MGKRTPDATGRERADEALRSVVDYIVDGVITIDEAGVIRAFNPAAETIFGYRAADVLGKRLTMLMPEPDASAHEGYVADYCRTGEAKIIGVGREVVGRRRDGSSFPIDLAVSEFRKDGSRFFTGIVRDISERKRLEAELRRRVTELAASDRRKDEFLAMLAHELRNPIAAITHAVQLAEVVRDPEQSDLSLEIIDRQARHLSRLIDDLLDVSRITQGKITLRKQPVNVACILKSSGESVRRFVDERKHRADDLHPAGALVARGRPHAGWSKSFPTC